jgi:hypothetical protein
MNFDTLTYTVAEMMGPPQRLTVTSSGEVRYESHSNRAHPDAPEIGEYQTKLGPYDLASLQSALGNPPFASLADHKGRIPAGDRLREVTVTTGSQSLQKAVGTNIPVDPSLAQLLTRLDRIVDETLRHPVRVLREEVLQLELTPTGSLAAAMKLTAVGTEPVLFVHPGAVSGGGVFLQGLSDKPPATRGPGETVSASAAQISEEEHRSEEERAQPIVRLEPGQSLTFRALAVLPPHRAGPYLIQLRYQNTVAVTGTPGALIGELLTQPIRINLPAAAH